MDLVAAGGFVLVPVSLNGIFCLSPCAHGAVVSGQGCSVELLLSSYLHLWGWKSPCQEVWAVRLRTVALGDVSLRADSLEGVALEDGNVGNTGLVVWGLSVWGMSLLGDVALGDIIHP